MDFATLVILFYRLHVDWTLFSVIELIVRVVSGAQMRQKAHHLFNRDNVKSLKNIPRKIKSNILLRTSSSCEQARGAFVKGVWYISC